MLILGEHYGYKKTEENVLTDEFRTILDKENYSQYFMRDNDEQLCFSLDYCEDKEKYAIETSYMIGVDWIVENELPIYVKPKLNTENTEIDYLGMLFYALKESENLKHLDNLYSIDFNKPLIEIGQHQDLLAPLLLIEFLQIVKQIVRKGLKKSYYKVTRNLNSRVKGKILINATIKKNHAHQKMLFNLCTFEEFGYNSIENKLLKKALLFTQTALGNIKGFDTKYLKHIFHYIFPAFDNVESTIDIKKVKELKPNPFFKEYERALKLAKLILKRYSYNISETTKERFKTPPFWIDMSKLFELYVYRKLREEYPLRGEVIYHKKFHGLEPDYLLKTNDGEIIMVIDAKYKPKYKDGSINLNDARQISGYARLKSIYKEFGIEGSNELIDCLVVYSDQSEEIKPFKESLLMKKEDAKYLQFYKTGIKLPELNDLST